MNRLKMIMNKGVYVFKMLNTFKAASSWLLKALLESRSSSLLTTNIAFMDSAWFSSAFSLFTSSRSSLQTFEKMFMKDIFKYIGSIVYSNNTAAEKYTHTLSQAPW